MFWTCPHCGNEYTSREVRDAHVAEIHGTSAPPAITVLRIWHRHGDDMSAHASRESANRALASYVRLWWPDEMSHVDGVPGRPDEFTDEEAIRLYFDHQDGTSEPGCYAIEELEICNFDPPEDANPCGVPEADTETEA